MTGFNNMTLAAAATVIGDYLSHADMSLLELEWGIDGRCSSSSKSAHAADLARVALTEDPEVATPSGVQRLSNALVETALKAPPAARAKDAWTKFVAGLRMDGFEAAEETTFEVGSRPWGDPVEFKRFVLRRMLPTDVPGLDSREAESELFVLLDRHRLEVPKSHLIQAQAAFARGDWAAANAQLRTFYEAYLDEIAMRLGYRGGGDSLAKRKFLGELDPPFLLSDYNEWHGNTAKPQFVQGLMSRLHPQGSHPGLSDADDCTFRMQISLITARLFLRRLDQRPAHDE